MQLAQYLPAIIKLPGGNKAGEVAGKVVDLVRVVAGIDDPATVVTTIQMDPAKAAEFRLPMNAQQSTYEQMYLANTQNARAMPVSALSQDNLFSKRFVYYFAAVCSLLSMIYFIAVMFWPPPKDDLRIAAPILGMLRR